MEDSRWPIPDWSDGYDSWLVNDLDVDIRCSLEEGMSCAGLDVSCSSIAECIQYGGLDGNGRTKESLLSIRITEAMVGLSATFSWTHSNPMWKHLINTSLLETTRLRIGSIRFNVLPSFQLSHACKDFDLINCAYVLG